MKRCKIRPYSFGLFALSSALTVVMCFLSPCIIFEENILDTNVFEILMRTTRAQRLDYCLLAFGLLGNASSNQWFIIAIPMLTALPFLLTFDEEIESNFYRSSLIRMSKRQYINRMFFGNALFGAGAVTVGYCVFAAIGYALFPRFGECIDRETGEPMVFSRPGLDTSSEAVGVLIRIVVFFTFAILLAQITLAFTLIMRNKFKGIGLPMVLFFMIDKIAMTLFYDTLDSRYYALSPSQSLGNIELTFDTFDTDFIWYFPIWLGAVAAMYLLCGFLCKRRVFS